MGIPVVTLNTDIENSKRIAYIGSHFYRSGETAGGLMHLMTHGTHSRRNRIGFSGHPLPYRTYRRILPCNLLLRQNPYCRHREHL